MNTVSSQIGDAGLLDRHRIALLCSVRCPGSVILQTYDLMRALRNESVTVISGFHSPMERECLNILLRGTCGIAFCYARSLPKRIPLEFQRPVADGRMLLLSPFGGNRNRATSETSQERNRLVARLADVVFVPYAAEGGKTEALCQQILANGASVLTLVGEHSQRLLDSGAKAVAEGLQMLTRG